MNGWTGCGDSWGWSEWRFIARHLSLDLALYAKLSFVG